MWGTERGQAPEHSECAWTMVFGERSPKYEGIDCFLLTWTSADL